MFRTVLNKQLAIQRSVLASDKIVASVDNERLYVLLMHILLLIKQKQFAVRCTSRVYTLYVMGNID